MIYILDAAALLNNELFSFNEGDSYFTTSLVFSEWRDFRSRALAESALSSGALKVIEPSSLADAERLSAETGTKMSLPDLSIVALAMDFIAGKKKFAVVTDDYSVQNLLKKIGAKFEGVAQKGIKKHRSFNRFQGRS